MSQSSHDRKALINQFCEEVYSMAVDQQFGFANSLHTILRADAFGADFRTKDLQQFMEETIAVSPTIQSGDKFRGLAKSKNHEHFTAHFRAMMFLQALLSIRGHLRKEEYELFRDDCLFKYESDYVFRMHIYGRGWQATPASGVFQQYHELYHARGMYKLSHRMTITFLDLCFFPRDHCADQFPEEMLEIINWEFEGFTKWADSLAKSATPAVKRLYGQEKQ